MGGHRHPGGSRCLTHRQNCRDHLLWCLDADEVAPSAQGSRKVCESLHPSDVTKPHERKVFVLKSKPATSAQPRILRSSAAAAAAASVSAVYALTSETPKVEQVKIEEEYPRMEEPERSPGATVVDINAATMEKKMLESRLLEARGENSRLRINLDESTNSFKELSMELQSIHGQLEAEKIRCSKLELQIAEIQKLLEAQVSIEQELEVLRHECSSRQEELAENMRQNSGVWQWMTGSS